MSVCRGGHQDGAGVGEGEWAAESLSLDVYPAVCAVGCPFFPSLGLFGWGADDLRGHFIDYLLERPDVAPVWHQFVNHPFVLAMGDATLPLESFKGYLIQDYLYLVHFARANALASYKAKTLEDITAVSLGADRGLGAAVEGERLTS